MAALHPAQLSGDSLNHTIESYSILLSGLSPPTSSNLTLHWESKRLCGIAKTLTKNIALWDTLRFYPSFELNISFLLIQLLLSFGEGIIYWNTKPYFYRESWWKCRLGLGIKNFYASFKQMIHFNLQENSL